VSKRGKRVRPTRFLGAYGLPSGESAFGELKLQGPASSLTLYSDHDLVGIEAVSCIKGTAYTGESLTLIDCVSPGAAVTVSRDARHRYRADVFPHYVAIGGPHVEPERTSIKAIEFTTSDLARIFYDFDAFSGVIDAKPIIDIVLQERRKTRAVEAGGWPLVQYFTGRDCVVRVPTAIGATSVHHRPRHNMGGPTGVFIKNRIIVRIEPERPVTFMDAVERMYAVASFLSMAAGRRQGISNIRMATTEMVGDCQRPLTIRSSLGWRAPATNARHQPHPGDVPLDPIHRRAEFEAVLTNWMARHHSWRLARGRYLECMSRGNEYGPDRLVAAANLFDLLPADAVPRPASLPDDLAATREECARLFREHPRSIERDSVLGALGRLGQPSLPRKVAHRASIVESELGARSSGLQFAAKVAVKVRNLFVHGSAGEVDFSKVEDLVPFLTDTLEFIFAASDFIEAGWDARRWNSEAHGWGHNFSRYLGGFDIAAAKLVQATSA
jgi:hypothetical protein